MPTERRAATGLAAPLFATGAPGVPGALYVVEQPGTVRVVRNGSAHMPFFRPTELSRADLEAVQAWLCRSR